MTIFKTIYNKIMHYVEFLLKLTEVSTHLCWVKSLNKMNEKNIHVYNEQCSMINEVNSNVS